MHIQRVIIADNQPITAYAIEHVVREIDPQVSIVYSSCFLELSRLLQESDIPTAVILDYTLFDFVNQEQLAEIAESTSNRTFWLLISDDLTPNFLRYILLNTKNIGILFKDTKLNNVKMAVANTLQGELFVQYHATRLLTQQAFKEEQYKDDLTQTEREVLKLIAQGKTTKEISLERFSSIHTINSHRKNIFRKLNVNSAHDAIKYALRSGIINESEFYV